MARILLFWGGACAGLKLAGTAFGTASCVCPMTVLLDAEILSS